jgi:hypothetical protein
MTDTAAVPRESGRSPVAGAVTMPEPFPAIALIRSSTGEEVGEHLPSQPEHGQ